MKNTGILTKICECLFVFIGLVLCPAMSCEKDDNIKNPPSSAITDGDGNEYPTVTIGNQVWLAEDLKTTKYNDGTDIPLKTGNDEWTKLTTPAYCWYSNDDGTNKITYGALYNWNAVHTGKLCPAGWHVPNFNEWNDLIYALGGQNIAGGKLKESGTGHWNSPNKGATNSSGFTALPCGYRNGNTGAFDGIGKLGEWWTSDGNTYYKDAWSFSLNSSDSVIYMRQINWMNGCCVRCIKDQ
jgi:uncharacterized protein (TIGR02145 family)